MNVSICQTYFEAISGLLDARFRQSLKIAGFPCIEPNPDLFANRSAYLVASLHRAIEIAYPHLARIWHGSTVASIQTVKMPSLGVLFRMSGTILMHTQWRCTEAPQDCDLM